MAVSQICPFTNQNCKAVCNLWVSQFNQCAFFLMANAMHRASTIIPEKVNNQTVAINELAKKLDNPNGIIGDALVKAVIAKRDEKAADEKQASATEREINASYKPDAKDIIDKYFDEVLDDDSWKQFVNQRTKDVYNKFVSWMNAEGVEGKVEQPMFTRAVLRRYGRSITNDNVCGGTYRLL